MIPMAKLAREIDKLSPEFRTLLRDALTGANGEALCCGPQYTEHARCRINEALTMWHPRPETWKRRASQYCPDGQG